jgi:hypothetical protein
VRGQVQGREQVPRAARGWHLQLLLMPEWLLLLQVPVKEVTLQRHLAPALQHSRGLQDTPGVLQGPHVVAYLWDL